MEAPFDITDIPQFAYVPSTPAWITLGIAAALLTLLYLLSRRTRRRRRLRLSRASEDLNRLLKTAEESELLARGSLLARRALSAELETDISVMSPAELDTLVATLTSPSLREAVATLATIESARFAVETAEPRSMIETLSGRLAAYAREKQETKS